MPLVVERSWVGRRVSVRRAVSHGPSSEPRYADVVGDLLALSQETAVLDTRRGRQEVRLADVAVARLAPPSTADVLALEASAASGWRPGESARLGGWLLRAAGGFTARANSVLPLRAAGVPLDEALTRAADWYAQRGLPLLVQVPTEARRLLDAELGERGWSALRAAHVLAGRLDMLGADGAGARVLLAGAPDHAWLARYRDAAAFGPTARDLLVRHDRVSFASVRDGDAVLAVGRAAVDGAWVGVSAVEVDENHRRAGLARAVVAALLEWGREHGAQRSYVQVGADNEPALDLYARLGYWHHHSYHYRQQP